MSAPTDRPDDSNMSARAFWLEQVSEAASVLSSNQASNQFTSNELSNQFRGNAGSSKISFESGFEPSVVREPAFYPPAPHPRSHLGNRSKAALIGGLGCVLFAVALTAVIAIGQFSLAEIWRQLVIDRTVELTSSSAAPATSAIQAEAAIPRLIVQSSRGMSGEPAPLGLTLQGRAEGAVVIITGLVPGMELSTGGAVGADAWEVSATDLRDVWIGPPKSFVGSVDLVAELRWPDNKIADRQTIHLEWVSPVLAQHQLDREEITAAPPTPPAQAPRQLDREEITAAPPIPPAPAPRQLDREEITAAPPTPPAQAPRQLDREEIAAAPPTLPAQAPRQLDRKEITAAPPTPPAPAPRQPDREEITAAPPTLPAPAQSQLDREEITAAPPTPPAQAPRQLDREEITAAPPIPPAPAPRQLDREEITAAPPIPLAPAQRQLDREEIAVLLKRGKDLIANGDLAAARLVLQRAADANDVEATLALAATYDPFVLRELRVYSFPADAEMARVWYEKARELGLSAASRRLEMLSSGAR
jgi:hypothetical protein